MTSIIRGDDNFDSQGIVTGTAKAWVNFNGTGTIAINKSYNVSSLVDNATGQYTVNYSSAMTDANSCVQITGGNITDAVGYHSPNIMIQTSTYVKYNVFNSGSTAIDYALQCVTIHS